MYTSQHARSAIALEFAANEDDVIENFDPSLSPDSHPTRHVYTLPDEIRDAIYRALDENLRSALYAKKLDPASLFEDRGEDRMYPYATAPPIIIIEPSL